MYNLKILKNPIDNGHCMYIIIFYLIYRVCQFYFKLIHVKTKMSNIYTYII